MMDLVPGDIKEDTSREKIAGLQRRNPASSYQGDGGNDSVNASMVRGWQGWEPV